MPTWPIPSIKELLEPTLNHMGYELYALDQSGHSGRTLRISIDHNEPIGTDCRQHFKQVATLLRSAFPDLHFAFEDGIAEGDKVAARVTMSGTHQGPGAFFGVPPSGKRFEIQQMRLLRIVDGQMKESWAVIDMLGWMQQLGAIPSRPAASGEALIRGR